MDYFIEATFQRTIPPKKLDRLIVEDLPIQFTLTCDGTVVARGSPSKSFGGTISKAEETRAIVSFKGEPGKTYELSLIAVKELPVLAPTHPIVRVSVPAYVKKDVAPSVLLLIMLAGGLALIGFLFTLPICVFLARRLLGRESSNSDANVRNWRGTE